MGTIPQSKISWVKKLYYSQGYSMKDIANHLNISINAVEYFMRHNNLERIGYSEANNILFSHKKPSFRIKKKFTTDEKQLQLIGTTLYWGEGSKNMHYNNCSVDFANCDPEMLKIFILFLRKVCNIDERKIRIYLYCYVNQDIEKNKKYWSKLLKIPTTQFTKPYIRQDFKAEKINRMPHGMIHIRYHDKKLFYLIKEWITEISKIN